MQALEKGRTKKKWATVTKKNLLTVGVGQLGANGFCLLLYGPKCGLKAFPESLRL
jgi:hypothetical protein